MSTVPTIEDTFDRLLAALPQIADAVNAFESEGVQQSAFDALVRALRIEDAPRVASASPVALATHHDAEVTESVVPTAQDHGKSETPAGNGRKRNGKRTGKRNFTVPRGLNFAPAGEVSLEDFVEEKAPRTMFEKNLVACYYLTEKMRIAAVDVGHVLAVYQAAGWTAPGDPNASLRNTAHQHGWLDTANTSDIKVVWKGTNFVETKMPSKSDSKKAA